MSSSHTTEKANLLKEYIKFRMLQIQGELEHLAFTQLLDETRFSASDYQQFCQTEVNKILLTNIKTNL